jgi:choline-sulfatase
MNRREFLKTGAKLTALSAFTPSLLIPCPKSVPKKNMVVIISDQHRWDVAGCYGNEYIATPNIDRLASEGVRFDNMYSQFPLCVPSRQSIITSQYASTHGTRENEVPPEQDTLIDHLVDSHGYHALLSGKSDMTTKAFEICIDHEELRQNLPADVKTAKDDANAWYRSQYKDIEVNETRGKINSLYLQLPLVEYWHDETLFCRAAHRILSGCSARPLFLWVSFDKPHTNWTPPERFLEKYRAASLPTPEPASQEIVDTLPQYLQQRRIDKGFDLLTQEDIVHSVRAYYACVEYMDFAVGLILDLLEDHDLVEDTIVVYTADHGEMLGHNGLYFKQCFYEPSVHVPCIMRCPGVIPAGQVVSQITELIDIMPTIMDFAHVTPAGGEAGRSMRYLIMDPQDPDWKNEARAEYGENYTMFRMGRWKYNRYPGDQDQLFDLVRDPDERHNLLVDSRYRTKESDAAGEILRESSI